MQQLRAAYTALDAAMVRSQGFAEVCLASGEILQAEVHWYEASGIGKREFKIKRFL
jgi:hypothetical protein